MDSPLCTHNQSSLWVVEEESKVYTQLIIITINTSPTRIGWVISQINKDGSGHPIRFGAKVLNDRQRGYAQVKSELWGDVIAIKTDRDYFIGAEVVIETNCIPILGMMRCCTILDIATFR
jgi:hypothetical protein